MSIVEIDDDLFAKFKEIIYDEAGIKLSDLKRALMQARVSKRLRALRIGTYRDYYHYLLEHYDDEKYEFINAITTNKTEFFRENKHFDFLKNHCLPDIESKQKKHIRIWSAGCSTGEEPYTIAIMLSEYFEKRKMPDVKILATDIDTDVLQRAVAGIYNFEQIKDIDMPLLKKYFYKGKDDNEGLFKIKEPVMGLVHFRRLNLMEEEYPMKGKFDIIFCRNVIIYFDRRTQNKLFEKFNHYLEDDGYLFIGHSENITNVSNRFSLLGHTIYRKTILPQ